MVCAMGAMVALGACEPDPEDNGLCGPIPDPVSVESTPTVLPPIVATGTAAATWYGGIKNIVRVRCLTCHTSTPQFGAPMSLETYDDTQREQSPGTMIYDRMLARIEASQSPMPPTSQAPLTEEEKILVRQWVEAGAPLGNESDDPGDSPIGGEVTTEEQPIEDMRPISRTVDILAKGIGPDEPYSLPVRETSYTCFAYRVPDMTGDEYGVRFEPMIDKSEYIHHILVFRNEDVPVEENVPFDCNGFPVQWDLIAGWSPGRKADNMPPGTGVRISPDDQIILQVHYNNVQEEGVTDETGYRMYFSAEECLAPAAMLWGGVIWGEPINGLVTLVSTCDIDREINLFSVFPHMHEWGQSISLEVRRGGKGSWTTLFNLPSWSADDQPNVPIDPKEQRLLPGDQLRTSCQFNTEGRSIAFGEAATDEMCLNFMYVYPEHPMQYMCVTAVEDPQ